MARQLGVKTLDDRAKELVAKGRVGHVELRLSAVHVDTDRDGFIARRLKRPLQVMARAYLVDGHGVHCVATLAADAEDAPAEGAGRAFDPVARTKESVRYERPAHFVIVVTAAVGDSLAAPAEDPRIQIGEQAPTTLDAPALSQRLGDSFATCVVFDDDVKTPGALLVLPGVHKHATTAEASIEHPRLTLRVSLDIRL